VAKNVRTAVKAAIRRGEAAGRRRIRSQVSGQLGELEAVYRRAAEEIRQEIAAAAGPDGNLRLDTLETLRRQIQARLDGLGRDRDELLQAGMREASRIGVSPFEQVPDMKTDLVNVADDALQFVRGLVAEDGLQLSDRLWRLNRGAREAVTESLEQAVIQGHSASRATTEFLSRGESVPASVRDKINDAQAEKVARNASRRLIKTDDDRSAFRNALRVFRTEINRAHGQAFQAAAFEHPDVIGTRFLLSPQHPEPDICDMHARVNLYGLGPGVYPKGKSPWPAHPNTLSFEQVVFADEPTQADHDGREDRISWLKNQEPSIQEAVLGSRKKRAALQRGILKQDEINTPWKVLKRRYRKRGVDIDNLNIELAPETEDPPGSQPREP